jgi:hypothetical protein
VSASAKTTISDTQAPSVPTNLKATAASSSQINLSWTASTDNVGVKGYKVYRGTTLIATTTTTSYANTGLAASTTYTYRVSAFDAAGKVSSQSVAASATTKAPALTVKTNNKNGYVSGISINCTSGGVSPHNVCGPVSKTLNTYVTLTALPMVAGKAFTGWNESVNTCYSKSGNKCIVKMNASKTIGANFTP